VRSLRHSVILGGEAAGGSSSDQSSRVSPAHKASHRSSPFASRFPHRGTAAVTLAAIFITAIHTGTKHYGVNSVAILQVVARFVVNVVDANLLQLLSPPACPIGEPLESPWQQSSPPPSTPAQSITESTVSPSHRLLYVSWSMWLMPTYGNRPVEPKSPSKVAPELITVKTAVFTGLPPTLFSERGFKFGLVTRFFNRKSKQP
jgi:hypothetical protein